MTATPALPRGARYQVSASCAGCGACLATCPTHALRPTGRREEPLVVRVERCVDCGECIEVCPVDALRRHP